MDARHLQAVEFANRAAPPRVPGIMQAVMLPRRALIFLFCAWALVMLYPDPGVLVASVRHTLQPSIQPQAAAAIAARLPNDPRAIEAAVLDRQVPYTYDWQTAGVPWYFPTTAEAVRAGAGDCESRAVVLAAVLTAKGIPNHLYMSLDHIWVDYPGKQANALENPAVQIAGRQTGRWAFHLPKVMDLGAEWDAQVGQYVTPAPPARVVLLLAGLSLIALWNALAWRLGAGRLAADGLLPVARPALVPPPARTCAGAPPVRAAGPAARLTRGARRRRAASPARRFRLHVRLRYARTAPGHAAEEDS